MWIILTAKLPTIPSPPMYSIHWAGASAADISKQRKQEKNSKKDNKLFTSTMLTDLNDKFLDNWSGGFEPKEDGAVWIIFDTEPLKVWPHEYNKLTQESFDLYLNGVSENNFTMSHMPMYGRTPLIVNPVTLIRENNLALHPTFNKDSYESAMIDGKNEISAIYTSMQGGLKDIWFMVITPYANYFGFSDEEKTPDYKDNKIYENIKAGWE